MFLVIASLETTSTLLSTMVWVLDQHPSSGSGWWRTRRRCPTRSRRSCATTRRCT
ncbi:hypothetical protein NKH77_38615 [Streptomyces sp. M19]